MPAWLVLPLMLLALADLVARANRIFQPGTDLLGTGASEPDPRRRASARRRVREPDEI